MFTLTTLFAAMLAMAPLSVNAHMIMASPVPYGSPNNSPLDPSGSDFPCKVGAGGSYEVMTMNEWTVGSQQILSFQGTAVHGGGSCQLAVTTDQIPSPSSKWKVIYSIEGGCPAAAEGNLASGDAPATYPFEVPSELPNGEMTVAWTWFNKIGNREMYMNCAPITVTGGSDDSTALDSLPDMVVANIQGQGSCKTPEGSDYTFANPGKYKTEIGAGPFTPICGGAPSGDNGGSPPAANPGIPSPPAANPGIPSVSPTANPGIPSVSPTANPGIPSVSPTANPGIPSVSPTPIPTSTFHTIVTVTAPQGSKPTVSPPYEDGAIAPGAPAQSPQAPATPGTGTDGTGSGTVDSASCSSDGAQVCNGETQFGICNWGTVTWRDVAPGTKCQDGIIVKRDYKHRVQRVAV